MKKCSIMQLKKKKVIKSIYQNKYNYKTMSNYITL